MAKQRRFSPEKKAKIIETIDQDRDTMSLAKAVKKHGIVMSQYYDWRKIYKGSAAPQTVDLAAGKTRKPRAYNKKATKGRSLAVVIGEPDQVIEVLKGIV